MAASGGAIRAGKAYVELYADKNRLARGLKQAEAAVMAFGRNVARIGAATFAASAAIAAPLALAVRAFESAGSELADMSARTGVSVEALSALGYAASQTGTDLGTVEGGLLKLRRVIDDAAHGSKTAQAALARLGTSAEELQGLDGDKQLEKIAAGLKRIPTPGERAAAAVESLGRSGAELIPMLADVEKLTGAAHRMGIVMSTADAQAADALGDALGDLWATCKSLWMQIGSALAPILTELAQAMQPVIQSIATWIKENKGLIASGAALWINLQIQWAEGVNAIMEIWRGFTAPIVDTFAGMWNQVMDATDIAIGWLEKRLIDAQKIAFDLRDAMGLGFEGDEAFNAEFAKGAVDTATDAAMGQRQRDAAKAQQQREDARAVAHRENIGEVARLQGELRALMRKAAEPPPDVARVINGIPTTLSQRASVGTFSAAQAMMFGGRGGVEDRIAKATEENVRVTKEVRQAIERFAMRLTFF